MKAFERGNDGWVDWHLAPHPSVEAAYGSCLWKLPVSRGSRRMKSKGNKRAAVDGTWMYSADVREIVPSGIQPELPSSVSFFA